jgi:glycosyltransferase involved in cell wall biosynthesis
MKVSGFNFLRNAQRLGFPFVESIRSVLPIVDEFVVALGPCDDDTEAMLLEIGDPKIRIIHTTWNEQIRNDLHPRGFVYAQQKSIALFNCTGDWAFYLEGDEVLNENELPKIRAAMETHLNDPRVEALVFDYLHFYGNRNTYAWSPAWYRTAPRILRNNIPAWAPEGLFFSVLEDHLKGRYPRAAHAGATIYHYGWIRSETQMNSKLKDVEKYWSNNDKSVTYAEIDAAALREFKGTHPAVMEKWLPPAKGLFQANPDHKLTRRERRHRLMLRFENLTGWRYNRKHYTLVR